MMKKLPFGKNAHELAQTVNWMLLPYKHSIKTITTDSGTEFAEHKNISRFLNTHVNFAAPYCSWQKGNIENTNKLIRQYIPKGTDFDDITEQPIIYIQYKINRRPREKAKLYDANIRLFSIFSIILHFDVESALKNGILKALRVKK